jgi:hypothetical protein
MESDQQETKDLPSPEYSEEERSRIISYVMSLRADIIRDFLANKNLPKSGIKPELRERIENALEEGTLDYKDLVNVIDSAAPCGKQHVFLYEGPASEVTRWKDEKYCNKVLQRGGVVKYLNARLPLILPKTLALSSIQYRDEELSVYGVERREHHERREEYDKKEKRGEDEEIELRAYVHQVTRGVIIFTWNLLSNEAMLQVSQMPSGSKYEEIEKNFGLLVGPWLNLGLFQKVDLRRAIRKLHELEDTGQTEARSHSIGYRTLGGRAVEARSPTPRDSVVGEPDLDSALRSIRGHGTGHIGNFYWLPSASTSIPQNPLKKEVHTIIVGDKGRINFTTPNGWEDIKYVLFRVRTLSK